MSDDAASVVLPIAALPALHPPPLCARTGRPARRTRRLTIARTPPGASLLLLLGGLGWVILWFACPKVNVALPIAPETSRRRVLSLLAMVVAFVAFCASVMALGTLSYALCGVLAAGTVVLFLLALWSYVDSWVGGTWVGITHVRLDRLHPAVAASYADQLAQLTRG